MYNDEQLKEMMESLYDYVAYINNNSQKKIIDNFRNGEREFIVDNYRFLHRDEIDTVMLNELQYSDDFDRLPDLAIQLGIVYSTGIYVNTKDINQLRSHSYGAFENLIKALAPNIVDGIIKNFCTIIDYGQYFDKYKNDAMVIVLDHSPEYYVFNN